MKQNINRSKDIIKIPAMAAINRFIKALNVVRGG